MRRCPLSRAEEPAERHSRSVTHVTFMGQMRQVPLAEQQFSPKNKQGHRKKFVTWRLCGSLRSCFSTSGP